ncbi:MAG: hypothetical protein R3D44_00210 [Hyphomicrobiaceae bacterium]
MSAGIQKRATQLGTCGLDDTLKALPLLAGAAGSALVIIAAGLGLTLGHASRHMLLHIALMNILAPLIAMAIPSDEPGRRFLARTLLASTVAQMVLLYLWHVPTIMHAHYPTAFAIAASSVLTLAAIWFWRSVLAAMTESEYWRAAAALVVSGKLFCVLGIVLTLLPDERTISALLSDRQTGGLIMVVACSSSYVLAAVLSAHRAVTAPVTRTDSAASR